MLARRAKHLDVVPPAEAVKRPTLRSVSPRYGEMIDKLRALNEREDAIQAELNELNPKLEKMGAYSALNSISSPPPMSDPGPNPKVVAISGDLMPAHEPREPLRAEWAPLKANF